MAKPNNLILDFPDYCCNCGKGDYKFKVNGTFAKFNLYDVECIYQDVCSHWASLLGKKEEMDDET